MIGLDTNILVRYLTGDDEAQFRAARDLMDSLTIDNPGYVTHVTLAELWWVLDSTYGFSSTQRCDVVERLLSATEIVVQDPARVQQALLRAGAKADLADALIAAQSAHAGCGATMTFDKNAARRAGMTLLAAH